VGEMTKKNYQKILEVAQAAMAFCNARYDESPDIEEKRLDHLERLLSSLPKSLHEVVEIADWADCAERAGKGDETAFGRLERVLGPYIEALAKRFKKPPQEEDDIKQECLIGLMKAARAYPTRRIFKKSDFIKFAKLVIRRHLIAARMGPGRERAI